MGNERRIDRPITIELRPISARHFGWKLREGSFKEYDRSRGTIKDLDPDFPGKQEMKFDTVSREKTQMGQRSPEARIPAEKSDARARALLAV